MLSACFLTGCSTGSSGNEPALAASRYQPLATASGTVTIAIPRAQPDRRTPGYVSGATQHAALFINGAPAAAGSTIACSPSSCTIAWTAAVAVPGTYTFAVEIDTGPAGVPANVVLAENSAVYAIHAGTNALATLTLNGVAGSARLSGETCSTVSCSGTLTISDAAGDPITSPGAVFDDTNVSLSSSNTATGTVSIPAAPIAAVTANGTYAYQVRCKTATGTFGINVTAGAASNAVSAAELANLSTPVTYPPSIIPVTQSSSTYICRTAETIAKVFFLTAPSGSLAGFAVPSDWNATNNSIEVIAAGGGGGGDLLVSGGGGGAYAIVTNQPLSGTVDFEIGAGGAGGTNTSGGAGGNTWFCRSTLLCTTATAANVIVAAGGGSSVITGVGGAVGIGSGSAGGGGGGISVLGATGGGGSGGPNGTGGTGGPQGLLTTVAAGGGGNGGGANGQGGTGTGAPAGAGGNSAAGSGGGAAPGGAGTNGGGGGGGAGSSGGNGGNGIEWSASFGSGGGGGASNSALGGNGGLYGGAGGGGLTAGGSGANGLVVVIYTP